MPSTAKYKVQTCFSLLFSTSFYSSILSAVLDFFFLCLAVFPGARSIFRSGYSRTRKFHFGSILTATIIVTYWFAIRLDMLQGTKKGDGRRSEEEGVSSAGKLSVFLVRCVPPRWREQSKVGRNEASTCSLQHIRASVAEFSFSFHLSFPSLKLCIVQEKPPRGQASESESTFSSTMFVDGPIRLSASMAVLHV